MEAIILAKGEKSKRLGIDKAFIETDRGKIIEVIIEKIKPLFEKIYIVSIYPEKFENYRDENLEILRDEMKCGPIGGIYTGLLNSNSFYNFVFASDMPFLNVDFVKYMIGIEKNYDVLVPYYKKRYEVLFAIYSKNVLKIIDGLIKNGEYKVSEILKRANVRYLKDEEIKIFDDGKTFFNLNNKNDLNLLNKFI